MIARERPVVISGILGFVGRRLTERLLGEGHQLVGVVRPGRDHRDLVERGIAVHEVDLARPVGLAEALEGGAAYVHLSGLAQVPGIVPSLEAADVTRGVFISSAGVYTKLPSPSAEAKRQGERALRGSAIDYTIIRPSMIYGGVDDRNLVRLLRLIDRWRVVPLPGAGRTLQQPVHVDDLVDAIVNALRRPGSIRQEYDVGGPEPLPLSEVVRIGAASLGRRAVIMPVPTTPVWLAAKLLNRLAVPTPVRPEQVLRLRESKAVSIAAAERDLGFRPRSFDEGILREAAELQAANGRGGC